MFRLLRYHVVLGQDKQHVQSDCHLHLHRLRNLHHRPLYPKHRRPIHSNDAHALQLRRTPTHALQNHQPTSPSAHREKSRSSSHDECHWRHF